MDRNAEQLRFVGQENPQLTEAPVKMPRSLGLANRSPLRNATEIFNGDPQIVPSGLRDKSFADAVIRVCLEARLASRQLLESALGTLCADKLKSLATILMPPALSLNFVTRESVPIRVNREIDHSKIYPQPSCGVIRIGGLNIARLVEVELAIAIHKIGLSLQRLEHQALTFPALVGNVKPSSNGPDRNFLAISIPMQNTIVIGDRPKGLEGALGLTVEFVGVGDIGYGTYNNLRGQIGESGTGIVVGKFVQLVLPEDLGFPCLLRQIVPRLICLFQSAFEGVVLLWRCVEFHLRSQFHIVSIAEMLKMSSIEKGDAHSSPQ